MKICTFLLIMKYFEDFFFGIFLFFSEFLFIFFPELFRLFFIKKTQNSFKNKIMQEEEEIDWLDYDKLELYEEFLECKLFCKIRISITF